MGNYMNELKTSLGGLVSTRTTNCKEGNVPSNTEVFKNYIKLCTDDIINTAIAKKQEVFGRIKEEIDNKTVNPFTEIEAVETEIRNVNAEIVRYNNTFNTYSSKLLVEDYELFSEYFESTSRKVKRKNKQNNERHTDNNMPFYDDIISVARNESQNINSNIRNRRLICAFITLIGVVVDTIILIDPFQKSNIGTSLLTILVALISAVLLDSLPTILGILSSKIGDSEKKLELNKSFNKCKADKKTLFFRRILFGATLFIMLLFFAVYILARALIFLGGGDFNRGIQLFLSENIGAFVLQLRDTEFLFADILNTLAPLISSLICLISSIIISVNETDFFDSFNSKIKGTFRNAADKCNTQKALYEERKKDLTETKSNKIQSVWRLYRTGRPPHNIELFSADVTAAAQMTAVNTFNGKYENFCQEARSYAELQINALKEQLSPYCSKPCDILNMPLSEDEQAKLDDIWSINGKQTENTINHISFIEQYICDLSEKWKSEEYEEYEEYAV